MALSQSEDMIELDKEKVRLEETLRQQKEFNQREDDKLKKEMDNILCSKPYNYDQSKIFSIIKSYNNDLYHKLINTVKNTYETPKKNYKRLILDNVIKSDNKIKSNFYRTIISTKNNKEKQDYHNIFFDNKLNRIVVEFFYYSKMNDE